MSKVVHIEKAWNELKKFGGGRCMEVEVSYEKEAITWRIYAEPLNNISDRYHHSEWSDKKPTFEEALADWKEKVGIHETELGDTKYVTENA